MKIRNHVLAASLQGDDASTMVRRIVASRPEFSSPPEDVAADLSETIPVTSRWLDEGLAKFERSFQASWPGQDDLSWFPQVTAERLHTGDGSATVQVRTEWTVQCVVEFVLSTGAWRAVFDHLFRGSEPWKARRSFDGGHMDLGWACMLVGDKGHEPLVSRRWLEFGPWWLRRFPGEVSLVQFHDLDADAETAFAQGTPGHKRMSDHDIGGWLRSSYRPGSSIKAKDIPEFRALYVPDDQSLRVVCAPGRVVSQREMLDACAERLVAKYTAEKPVRSLRYVFIDPADAECHLHEMWLRDIEVWTIVSGQEVRLDDGYTPVPLVPEWVHQALARNDQ